MTVTQVTDDHAGAKMMPTPVGAFAALLVEWKLAQSASDTKADQPTLKSA
jgi:hypothetical protein